MEKPLSIECSRHSEGTRRQNEYMDRSQAMYNQELFPILMIFMLLIVVGAVLSADKYMGSGELYGFLFDDINFVWILAGIVTAWAVLALWREAAGSLDAKRKRRIMP